MIVSEIAEIGRSDIAGFMNMTFPQPIALCGVMFDSYRALFFLFPTLLPSIWEFVLLASKEFLAFQRIVRQSYDKMDSP